jgi:NADPH-dependent 2,4-dienoyl-CoA reductase/sulfur reductase-like enzyme/ferredoxin
VDAGMNETAKPILANFMQIEPVIPRGVWHVLRLFSIITFAALIWGLWNYPDLSLAIFWGIAVPVLPLVFWLLPGLWRNLCPLAAGNQLPRLLKFSLAKEVPATLKRYASVIGLILLFGAVSSRKIIFNEDAYALSFLLIGAISFAFIGGLLFKGKSGWCGSFCPLLPVQRLYGQTPFVNVNNSHCAPCVGCTKNCFDFNPQVAYLADLYDRDPVMAGDRKFFAGMMPGLILAYFYMPYSPDIPIYQLYLQFGFYCLIGVGAYQVVETVFKFSPQKNTALFALISINIFYWYAAVIILQTVENLSGFALPEWPVWSIRTAVVLISAIWFWKTVAKEKLFLSQAFASSAQTKVASMRHLTKHAARQTDNPAITIQPGGEQLVAKPDTTLLDLLEANGHKINSGCRMGACGADPVAIVEGEENLPEKSAEEAATLERLGYNKGVRLACCINIAANIAINLDPSSVEQYDETVNFEQDDSIRSVVIIGNGIAGVTAADFVRRHHKDCEIHLIGAEKYPLYNRMAISKLIYGRTALQSLILMPDEWYAKRNIQLWLNTQVESIDSVKGVVKQATGETINFDRLIITTGSNARIPAIQNWGIKGCFALRTAEDGMSIRTYLQDFKCKRVVIAGGGLLGLEAAYAFTQLGIRVTVLERSTHLLKRQLDARSGEILHDYLSALGMTLKYQSEVKQVIGEDRIEAITLKSGKKMAADLLMVAAGIDTSQKKIRGKYPKTNKGILVDDHLCSSIRNIYAAGDIAELKQSGGRIPGLWPVAVEQGRIAAINALGGDQVYTSKPVAVGLKVAGVELTSMGIFNRENSDTEVCFTEKERYRKIVIRENKLIGCILLGYPELSAKVSSYINLESELSDADIESLKNDNWALFV